MTDKNYNLELLNLTAAASLQESLENIEGSKLSDEEFLGDLLGKMIAAGALGWNIIAMAEEAEAKADRLFNLAEEAGLTDEQAS